MNHEYITFGTCAINKLNSFLVFQFQTFDASIYVAGSCVLIATIRNSIHFFYFRLMMLHFMQPDPTFLLQLHLDFWSIGYHDQDAIDVVNEKLSRFA